MMPGTGGPGKAGGSSTGDGPATPNTDRKQGEGEFEDIKEGDSEAGSNAADVKRGDGKGSDGRAWFTSLPEAIRSAVKSRGKKAAPKGYEELLRRYFEDQ
jgi:hypothetical protein